MQSNICLVGEREPEQKEAKKEVRTTVLFFPFDKKQELPTGRAQYGTALPPPPRPPPSPPLLIPPPAFFHIPLSSFIFLPLGSCRLHPGTSFSGDTRRQSAKDDTAQRGMGGPHSHPARDIWDARGGSHSAYSSWEEHLWLSGRVRNGRRARASWKEPVRGGTTPTHPCHGGLGALCNGRRRNIYIHNNGR